MAELAREALLCGFLNAELLAYGLRGGAFRAVGAFGFETAFGLDDAFGYETDGARAFAPPDDLSRLVAPRSLAFAVFDRPDPPGFSAESDFGRGRSALRVNGRIEQGELQAIQQIADRVDRRPA